MSGRNEAKPAVMGVQLGAFPPEMGAGLGARYKEAFTCRSSRLASLI